MSNSYLQIPIYFPAKAQKPFTYGFFLLTIAVSLLAAFLPHSAHATSIKPVTVDEALNGSELVIEGKVIHSEARKSENSRMLHTYITIEILEVVKGSYTEKTIELSFMGGTVGNLSMQVGEMDYPKLGEHGIYFVESIQRNQANALYGWSQGHFLIRKDADGVDRVTTNKNTPVTGMNNAVSQRNVRQLLQESQALSDGEARGMQLNKAAPISNALSVQDFKQALSKMSAIPSGIEAGGQQ